MLYRQEEKLCQNQLILHHHHLFAFLVFLLFFLFLAFFSALTTPFFTCWAFLYAAISLSYFSFSLANLFIRLLFICSSIIPHLFQILCTITNRQAWMLSFDFGAILRIKTKKRKKSKEASWVHWDPLILLHFPSRRGFHFSFTTDLVHLCHVFNFSFLFRRHGLPPPCVPLRKLRS